MNGEDRRSSGRPYWNAPGLHSLSGARLWGSYSRVMILGMDAPKDPALQGFPRSVVAVFFLWVIVVGYLALDFCTPGGFIKRSIVEELNSPVPVRTWNSEGLILEDGRHLPLQGISELPSSDCPLLKEALRHGIELDGSGRIYGLIRVHHWCGNDPVRRHLARIELSKLLIYTRLGKPSRPLAEETKQSCVSELWLGDRGWSSSQYFPYESWAESVDAGLLPLFED